MSTYEEKVRAVMERDPKLDGEFVYGVKSTKIYCRPSCPSRKPKPENLVLFDTRTEAEAEGFRACLRCNPKEPDSPNEAFVEKVVSYIAGNIDQKLTLNHLAEEFNVSKYHLQRTFKSVLGITPRQFIESRRLDLFKSGIRNGDNVDAAMRKAGFQSRSRLYEKTPGKLGMTPTQYRDGGESVALRYTITYTPITKVLLASSGRGLCAVYMGDDEPTLEQALSKEYPLAAILRDDDGLGGLAQPLLAYFNGENFNPRISLDIHRTAFQWKVYRAIQEIPSGETRTYTEIANSIGKPKAVRAVANACARNPVGIVVPCHRVLRKNGGVGGYRWGLPLKERLLNHESV